MIVLSKGMSERIKLLTIICIVMVVGIHSRTPEDIPVNQIDYLVQEFLGNGLFRVAIPSLFLTSGLLFFRNVDSPFSHYVEKVKSRCKTIVIPYCIYSLFTLCLSISMYAFLKQMNYGFSNQTNTEMAEALPKNLLDFLYSWLIDPNGGHLWFLRDLTILVLLSPLIFLLIEWLSYPFLVLLFGLWLSEVQPFPLVGRFHLLNIESLLFFSLGAYLAIKGFNLERHLPAKRGCYLAGLWILLTGIRVWIDPTLYIWYERRFLSVVSLILYKESILVGVVAVMCLTGFLLKLKQLLWLSQFSFPIYLFHSPFNIYLRKILRLAGLTHLPLFFTQYLLNLTLTTAIALILWWQLPALYRLISGGRGATA